MQHTAHLASTIIAAIITPVTVVIVFFMILIAITILVVVGIVCYVRVRRKNGQGTPKSDATDPNPVHYHSQGIIIH